MADKNLVGNKSSMLRSPLSGGLIGFARAMDFQIVLPRWGDYEKLVVGEETSLSTYMHEWVHYFQLTSTNAGHALIDLHRAQFEFYGKYLVYLALHHGWDFSCPAVEFHHQDDSSSEQSATLVYRALILINNIFRDNFSNFSSSGYIPQLSSRIPKIDIISDLRLPSATVSVDGWQGTPSLIQVLEHAAVTAEALSGNGFTFERFFDPVMADYFFGYWYLHQQKIIKLRPVNSKTKIQISYCSNYNIPEAVFYCMFLFTQIALNVSEMVEVEVKGDSNDWWKIVDPGDAFPISATKSSLAGAIFCDLLKNFKECFKVVKEEYDTSGSWVKAASAVCQLRGFPKYDIALSAGIYRMERYVKSRSKDTPDLDRRNV